ncbi:HAD hydrolase family protein [Amylolactobacillus amylophilus]|uniref:HAD hydrolase family protein n=1 Tax=Amylolactobacillus amylophilus TaxID=1603 RepID=UPI0006CF6620|nr:HAD hydrolase family protein [Amylolactobacillus amylophilus]
MNNSKLFFPGKADEIAFVSDNGSQIFEHDQLVNATTIPRPVVTHILADVFKLESLKHVTLSGLRSAYILESATPAGRQNARQYYYTLKEVSDFPTVDDDISKINLLVDDAVKDSVTATINERFPTAASMYCGRSVRPVKSCSFKRSIYSSVFLFK